MKGPKAFGSEKLPYGRGTGIPNPVDVHVGKRIRMRRMFIGMSQDSLAKQLGVTFQQVQKYEEGANRVSASRLAEVANVLGVSIPHFFVNLPKLGGTDPSPQLIRGESLEQSETIQLVRFYYGIANETVRHRFAELVKSIAARYQTS